MAKNKPSFLPRAVALSRLLSKEKSKNFSMRLLTFAAINLFEGLMVIGRPLRRLSVVRQFEAPVTSDGKPLGQVFHGKTEVDEGRGGLTKLILSTSELIPLGIKEPMPFIPVHGFRSNKTGVRYLNDMAKALCTRGIGTHAFDNPGSGKSKGLRNTPKPTRRALESVFLNVRKKMTSDGCRPFYKHAPIIGGFSMGAMAAVAFAARERKNISGLFLDSPLVDFSQFVGEKMAKSLPDTFGKNNDIYDLRRLIPELDDVPILISYTTKDPVVKKGVLEFYEAVKEHREKNGIKTPCKLMLYESERHMGGFYENPQEYIETFTDFFKENKREFDNKPNIAESVISDPRGQDLRDISVISSQDPNRDSFIREA